MGRRGQGKRGAQRDWQQSVVQSGKCPACGKLRLLTKDDAKKALRRMNGRKGRLHAYPCGAFWHVGHPPRDLVAGRATRDEVEARRPA